jgi:hypothetical protein
MSGQTDKKNASAKLSTKKLTNMAFAYKQSGTLIAALEHDLFLYISQGENTVEKAAESMKLPVSTADKLLTACTALGLLKKKGEFYSNSPEADRYLVKGSKKYYGDFLIHQAKTEYDNWKDLGAAFRKPPMEKSMYHSMMQDEAFARALTIAGYNSSIMAGYKLAREFDFSSFTVFLDLGGGSGCYSIPAVLSNPRLNAIVFDFPAVIKVTREFAAQAGVSDRIAAVPGDFMADDLPKGADLVSIIGNLHAYSLDETEFVIQKAFDALTPGGTLLVIDYMLNRNKTGPLEAALHHLSSAATLSKGCVKSTKEMSAFMKKAGAKSIEVHDFIPGSMSRVTGKKPK